MIWVEVSVDDWFKTCTPDTEAPPEVLQFLPWRVPEQGCESDMYPAVNEGCNDYLQAARCTTHTTCCTDSPKDDVTSQYNDEDWACLDYNADCPDLVIFPVFSQAVEAHKWEVSFDLPAATSNLQNRVPSLRIAEAESLTSASPGLTGPFPVAQGANAPDTDNSFLQVSDTGDERPPPKVACGHTSWAWAEVLVEVKKERHRFPFLHGKDAEFAPTGVTHVRARGQITEYALEVLTQQHSQAVFMLLILDDHARFLRYDRNGAIVSAAFNYHSQPRTMGEFFFRLFGGNASAELRGHDPTARLVTGQDADLFRDMHKTFARDPDVASALQFAGSPGWPIYDLEVTGTWSPDFDSPLTTSSASSLPVTTHICRVGRPIFASNSIVGRGTRCFVGYDMTFQKPILIKDTWRIDSPAIRTEAETYEALWDRATALQAEYASQEGAAVVDAFIPTLLCSGDVVSPPPPIAAHVEAIASARETTQASSTGTLPDSAPMVQRTLTQNVSKKPPYSPRIHHRLAFKEICRTIEDFRSPLELAVGVFFALRAHSFAWEECGILHGDISVGNILLCRDSAIPGDGVRIGLLADWDLAKTREQLENPTATQVSRSGTWQFMSALIQSLVSRVHAVSDDLESFLHVLNWCALKYLPHSRSKKAGLASYFFNIYDKALSPIPEEGSAVEAEVEGPEEKLTAVRKGLRVVEGFPEGHPLDVLLEDLTTLCKSHYDTIDLDHLLPEDPFAMDPDIIAPSERSPLPHLTAALPPRLKSRMAPATRPAHVAHATTAKSADASPLKDHTAFISAFYNAIVESMDAWTQGDNARLVRIKDQIPSIYPLDSVAAAQGTGSKRDRELALPTGSVAENAKQSASVEVTFKELYTPDNPPVKKRKTVPS